MYLSEVEDDVTVTNEHLNFSRLQQYLVLLHTKRWYEATGKSV